MPKPRDFLQGIKSGLQNLGAGTLAGTAALLSGPLLGARRGGLMGFAKGLGAGVVLGIALPVAGLCNGDTFIYEFIFSLSTFPLESFVNVVLQ